MSNSLGTEFIPCNAHQPISVCNGTGIYFLLQGKAGVDAFDLNFANHFFEVIIGIGLRILSIILTFLRE